MRVFFSFLFALFFAQGVISVPTAPQRKSRSYKVERVRRGNDDIHGPAALRKAYRKFGIVPSNLGLDLEDFEPIHTKHASIDKQFGDSEPEQSGAVSAISVQDDAAFVSPVLVGGQKLVLNFDTGSADLYVYIPLPINRKDATCLTDKPEAGS